jgi:creatinine deaminase
MSDALSSGANFVTLDDELYMSMALNLALESYASGGCPIGSALVDNATGTVLGKGHNELVQSGNPTVHGELAALRDAKRMNNRHDTSMYTTMQPCFMCAGAIVMFGIPRVVIGDATNPGDLETIVFLQEKGVEVIVLDPRTSPAAFACIQLGARYKSERPELWIEDSGGGKNLRPKNVR